MKHLISLISRKKSGQVLRGILSDKIEFFHNTLSLPRGSAGGTRNSPQCEAGLLQAKKYCMVNY